MAETLASASASSSASSHGNCSYQIFINHRGSDVKKTFASHLYRRLLSRGFRVFLDQSELQRGETIDCQIKRAIATASVHVAILSSGYAQSRWCLDELVLMLKSREDGTATVIPIFYDVKPSELRWTKEGTDNNVWYAQALRILRWTGIDRVYALALRVLRWTGIHRLYAPALSFLMVSLVFYNVKPSDLRWADNGKNSDRVCAEALRILRQTGRYRVFVHALRILRWTGKDSMYVQALRNLRWTSSDRVYAEALINHEKKGRYSQERVAGWRKALYDVSHISGFELEACNGDEGVLVDEVVRQVQKKVGKAPLPVATHPTGLDEKLQQLERTVLWEQQHNRGGPNIVGIVGSGGLGKTTLAKFFFNKKRSDYQQSCFLHDVRDAAARCSLPSLQSELYKDLSNGGDQVMRNVDEGIATLKDRLSCSQALIVMDDVDDVQQLDALFSPVKDVLPSGSLILFTSRDLDVLRKYAGIQESSIYKMTGLDPEHSQQLFCSYAFHQPYPALEYEDLVTECLNVCQGLPLSLQVIGALLYSGSCEYWKDQLRKLSQVLPTKIQSKLMISYDSLDKEEKEMFLDIACFFIGMKKDTAINLWDGSGWNGSLGLGTLESKCLVTVDEENCLRMHDHLRDLGRELAELPGCPRRLWRPTDSLFRNVPTTSTVRGLTMIRQGYGESSQSPLEFNDRIVDMSGLQLLRAPVDCLERIFKVLGHPELLWLRCEMDDWDSLPSWIQRDASRIQRYPPGIEIKSCLSSWIPIKNLRVLELVYQQLWYWNNSPILGTLWNTEYEAPVQLRELNIGIGLFELPKSIGQLKYLQKIEVHDFRGTLPEEFFHLCSLKHLRLRALMESLSDSLGNFTSLQHIDLSGCWELQTLPPSFGNLAMLQHIDLSGCWELQTLPASIGNLKQVQYINLSGCSNLQRLPQSFGDLTNLQEVMLRGCGKLKMLPDSMNLIRLKHLDLSGCRDLILTGQTLENVSTLESLDFSWCGKMEILPSQVTRQQFLEKLILRYTNLKEWPNDFEDLSNLEILDISSPSLETLPQSLGKLMKLKELTLCSRELKELPDSVGELKQLTLLSIDAPIREVTFASVEKVQGGRRLLDSCIDKCMPRLKRLHLLNTRITEISFGEGVCPVLEELHLRDCRALKKLRGLRGLAKLRSLNMEGCIEIEDLPALGVLEFDNLTDLNLKECAIGGVLPFASVENVGGDCRWLDSSIDKCMLRLSVLELSKTRITEISFGEGVCPALKRLILEDCAELVEVGALPTTLTDLSLAHCCALKKLKGFRGLAKLRSLNMEGCREIEDLPALGVFELDNLRDLNLKECAIGGVLSIASVENVGGHCRLLDSSIDKCMLRRSSLKLSKTRITEISFGEGVCPALECLYLEDCAELVEVGALPTTLTYLSLKHCCALKKLRGLRGLANLRSLNMEGCIQIEDPRDLGVWELDNLIELNLRECAIGGVLPFASVENVGGDCRLLDSSIDKCMLQLKFLYLSKTRITEISFGEGVCPALEYLYLEDCAELVEVGALPTTLKDLSLKHCCALKKISYM